MDASCIDFALDASESDWIVLNRISSSKQAAIASEMGVDAGQFSTFVAGKQGLKLDQFKRLLETLNLRVVDANSIQVAPETYRLLTQIAGTTLLKNPMLMVQP